jgi:hypothetical protein
MPRGCCLRRQILGKGSTWFAFLAVLVFLSASGPWRFPLAPDGLLVLRTAEALAFEKTFVLPPAAPGASFHPWFFRAAPGGKDGVVSIYQPFSPLWRAAALAAAGLAPPGPKRGALADFLLAFGPILITSLCVFPLSRLFRMGGLERRKASLLAGLLVVCTFLGPLGVTDFSEPPLVLFLCLAFERVLLARRLTGWRQKVAFTMSGFFGMASNLVKPVGAACGLALLVPALFPLRGKRTLAPVFLLAAGALPALGLFLFLNVLRTGKLLEIGYTDQPLTDTVSPFWTFLRIVVLPSRGLIWFAPLFVVAIPGVRLLFESRRRRIDAWACLLGFGPFFGINMTYWAWEGGMGWSPRYMAPALLFLAPLIGAGARRMPGLVAPLAIAGLFLNLPGYLLDYKRIYDSAQRATESPGPLGPVVALHRDASSPEGIHPIQRPHYVTSFSHMIAGQRILMELVFSGDSFEAGGLAPGSLGPRNDAFVLRAFLGSSSPPGSVIGKVLLDEAVVGMSVDLARSYRFARRSLDYGGPPLDARSVAAYLAFRTGRFEEALMLCEEGLKLDASRTDFSETRRHVLSALGRAP